MVGICYSRNCPRHRAVINGRNMLLSQLSETSCRYQWSEHVTLAIVRDILPLFQTEHGYTMSNSITPPLSGNSISVSK